MKFLLYVSILSTAAASRRSLPTPAALPTGNPDLLSQYGPTKVGTWGLPKVDTKEVKPVKRISKKPDESKPEKHCGPWGVVSVHEVEDIMGLE